MKRLCFVTSHLSPGLLSLVRWKEVAFMLHTSYDHKTSLLERQLDVIAYIYHFKGQEVPLG